MAYGYKQEN